MATAATAPEISNDALVEILNRLKNLGDIEIASADNYKVLQAAAEGDQDLQALIEDSMKIVLGIDSNIFSKLSSGSLIQKIDSVRRYSIGEGNSVIDNALTDINGNLNGDVIREYNLKSQGAEAVINALLKIASDYFISGGGDVQFTDQVKNRIGNNDRFKEKVNGILKDIGKSNDALGKDESASDRLKSVAAGTAAGAATQGRANDTSRENSNKPASARSSNSEGFSPSQNSEQAQSSSSSSERDKSQQQDQSSNADSTDEKDKKDDEYDPKANHEDEKNDQSGDADNGETKSDQQPPDKLNNSAAPTPSKTKPQGGINPNNSKNNSESLAEDNQGNSQESAVNTNADSDNSDDLPQLSEDSDDQATADNSVNQNSQVLDPEDNPANNFKPIQLPAGINQAQGNDQGQLSPQGSISSAVSSNGLQNATTADNVEQFNAARTKAKINKKSSEAKEGAKDSKTTDSKTSAKVSSKSKADKKGKKPKRKKRRPFSKNKAKDALTPAKLGKAARAVSTVLAIVGNPLTWVVVLIAFVTIVGAVFFAAPASAKCTNINQETKDVINERLINTTQAKNAFDKLEAQCNPSAGCSNGGSLASFKTNLCLDSILSSGASEITLFRANAGQVSEVNVPIEAVKEVTAAGNAAGVSDTTTAFVISVLATESLGAGGFTARGIGGDGVVGTADDCLGIAQVCSGDFGGGSYEAWTKAALGSTPSIEEFLNNPVLQMKTIEVGVQEKIAIWKSSLPGKSDIWIGSARWLGVGCDGNPGEPNRTCDTDYGDAAEKNFAIITCNNSGSFTESDTTTTSIFNSIMAIVGPTQVSAQSNARPQQYSDLDDPHKEFLAEVADERGYLKYSDAGSANQESLAAYLKLQDAIYENVPGVSTARVKTSTVDFNESNRFLNSGYRSYDDQIGTYFNPSQGVTSQIPDSALFSEDGDREVSKQAYLARAQVSAPPGYSKHHTGLVFDIYSANSDDWAAGTLGAQIFNWLNEDAGSGDQTNAESFGFELSNDGSAGSIKEEWEWLYTGGDKKLADFREDAASSGTISNGCSVTNIGGKAFSGKFEIPLPNSIFTSPHGPRNGRQHRGIDMSSPGGIRVSEVQGQNVLASAPGEVVKTVTTCPVTPDFGCTEGGGFGNWVRIKHNINGEEIFTNYAHLYKVNVEVGQQVQQGAAIGIEGNSGSSGGLHLHFEIVLKGDNRVDPCNGYIQCPPVGGSFVENSVVI